MRKETKDLVNSIQSGSHSEAVNKFCRSAVDFVERQTGPSEDTFAVTEALDRKVRQFLEEHPGSGCVLNRDGTITETGPFRRIGKFADL